MKILSISSVVWISFFFLAQAEKDPFAENERNPIGSNITAVHFAREWVDEELLDAFGEPKLAVSGDEFPCYRIFIQLESSNPILLKYLVPSVDRKSPSIELKKLSKVNGKWTLMSRRFCAVEKDSYSLLHEIFELADPMRLPIPDWEPEGKLGGTCWVYEFPVPDGFIVFVRQNPLGVGPEDALLKSEVSMERYAREQHLTMFVMMLCTKVGGKFDFSGAR